MKKYCIKKLDDGRAVLNLGCGTKMNYKCTNLDFSPYTLLVQHMTLARLLRKVGFLTEERYKRLLSIDPEIIHWDLRKGIPFPDEVFDVVYHSHLLEHIDKDFAPVFLKECYRILKKDGIIRIVVPDLQKIVNSYILSLNKLENGIDCTLVEYQQSINSLFEQMVRRQATGIRQQKYLVRLIERLFRGDASSTGELHRWMYDKFSLGKLLMDIGFKDISPESHLTSKFDDWYLFNLDTDENGNEYKIGSLYMEGKK